MYDSKTMLWKEKERLGLYRWTTSENCWVLGGWIVSNTRIRELCKVKKGLDERID